MCGGRGRGACRNIVQVPKEDGGLFYVGAEVIDIVPNEEWKICPCGGATVVLTFNLFKEAKGRISENAS